MNIIFKPALIIAMFLSLAGMACAQTNELVGHWTNTDAKTRGVTRLIISQDMDLCVIQAWGKCHPTDCDWGKVELKLFGDSVDDKSPRYGFAYWDAGFADTYITLRIENTVLVVETFTCFKDKSKRSDYRSAYSLRRQ